MGLFTFLEKNIYFYEKKTITKIINPFTMKTTPSHILYIFQNNEKKNHFEARIFIPLDRNQEIKFDYNQMIKQSYYNVPYNEMPIWFINLIKESKKMVEKKFRLFSLL